MGASGLVCCANVFESMIALSVWVQLDISVTCLEAFVA